MKNFMLIAHRGIFDNKLVIENTIPAFQNALLHNLNIELDVKITKDNQLVVFHDDNLLRMANENILIEDLTLEELQSYKLLNIGTIPTLKEVLNLVNNKVLLDIEIKNTNKIDEITSILKNELKSYHNFTIKSFNPRIIKIIKKECPFWIYGLIISAKNKNLYNKILINIYKPDFISVDKKIVNKKYLKKYSLNHNISVWTIKNKEELLLINNPNYQYICNNLPYEKSIN